MPNAYRSRPVPAATVSPGGGWAAVHAWPILGAIVILGLGLRLFDLGTHALWLDEALSLHYARLPFRELITRLSEGDVNPPFYYLLLKAWTVLGDSEFILRLPSALAGVLVIPLTFVIGSHLSGRRAGLLAAALVATSDLQLRYSQEARPYSLMTLAAAVSIWGLLKLLEIPSASKRLGPASDLSSRQASFLPWLAYIGGTAVALHLHNTMVLLPACSNGIALVWWFTTGKRRRGFLARWLVANTVVLVLWSPALLLAASQALGVLRSTWMRPTDAHGAATLVANTYTATSGGRWVMILFVVVAAGGAWTMRRRPWPLAFALTFAGGVPLLTYLISLWRPIMLQRTLLWPTLMVTILVAAGCTRPRSRPAMLALAALLLALQGMADVRLYQRARPEPWDQLVKCVQDGLRAGDAVLVTPENYRIPFRYYFARPEPPVPLLGLARGTHPEVESLQPELIPLARVPHLLSSGHRVWLVLRRGRNESTAEVRQALATTGTASSQHRFGDLELFLFDPRPEGSTPGTGT